MTLIQIVLLVACLFGVVGAFIRYRKGDVRPAGLVLWIIFWIAAALIVLWPDATFYFSKKLGVGRGADLIVYLALVLLFFLVFRLIISVERQRREITQLTRLVALNKIDDKTK